MAFGFVGQLLDAVEGDLFGVDQRALRLDGAHEALLHEVEFADRLVRQHHRRIEARVRLERRA